MNAQSDWWKTFFAGPMVDWWLRMPLADATKADADFLEATLGVKPGAKLLDIPCGGGRHALVLAARGYAMTGVDISPEFLTAAQSSAEERKLDISWHEAAMQSVAWKQEFDGAYCLGNSFGYLTDEDNAAFLKAVAGSLKPGAKFVFETGYVAECLFPSLQERACYPDDENYVLALRQYDPIEARLHVEYTVIRGSHQSTHVMSARVYTVSEIITLLNQAGFGSIEVFSSHTREPVKLGSRYILAVGTK